MKISQLCLALLTISSTVTFVSSQPTRRPTAPRPTRKPTTARPTRKPTTARPTRAPTTRRPTGSPTPIPTLAPTRAPTPAPTLAPTRAPTSAPTRAPTSAPTRAPTSAPTSAPTQIPTITPTFPISGPTNNPSTFYECPLLAGSISFFSSGAISFSIPSGAQNLCTLVQFSSTSQSFKPVARSYDGYDWEASSGEFSFLLWNCSGTSCTVNLPPLPSGSVYQLTTFAAPQQTLGGTDEVARFLEQATFGPTRGEIGTFNINASLPVAFAAWIKAQQDTVPPTSHRASFRQRMNSKMETATHQGAVTSPCQKGARFQMYAFSSKDAWKYVDIQTVGTKRIIKVDGFVRTVVDGPVYRFWDPSQVWPDGSYQLANSMGINELGGNVYLYLPSVMGNADASFNGQYGNPTIKFDSSIGANPNVLLTLSAADATPIDSRYFAKASVANQEIVLTKDLTAPVCNSLKYPGNPVNPVFALYNNVYWYHDPRFKTINNTVDSPAPDGGGKLSRETFNIVQPDLTAICANAPRTFLNEDSCILSDMPTACTSESYNPWDNSNRPSFYVNVTSETMRGIYNATGGGIEGTRYLYAVQGLRVADDKTIGMPCERTGSRWIRIACTGAHTTLNQTVHEIFSNLLKYTTDSNPYMRDVWNWWSTECPSTFFKLSGFEVQEKDSTQCWKNVHPDHLSVYDMTYWTRLDGHPGNSAARNPIKEFAEAGSTTLNFPSWHSMNRWSDNKWGFGFVGRLGDVVHYYSLPKELRSQKLNTYFRFTAESINYTDSKGVIVCGSPFEVANDLSLGGSQGRGAYDSDVPDFSTTDFVDFMKQKRIVWTEIALNAKDQLRQRVAWALSQILVVSPSAIDSETITEAMTLYYDTFVRHAFGSYRSILKEVSYSPVMAQMLTYYGSRSTFHTWQNYGNLEYPDENYAREIMQLFSIGMYKLNNDGSVVRGSNGDPVRAYTNDDIMEYARLWTGMVSRTQRGNIENIWGWNRVDPLRIDLDYRDMLPKMGLNRKYIGDGVPLCADLPSQHFLKAGATFRLLGRSPDPYSIWEPKEWKSDPFAKRLKLEENGDDSLFVKLCGSRSSSQCTHKSKVVLNTSLACSGKECSVDTVRIVQIGNGTFYEYTPPPCVFQAFYPNAKMVVSREGWWGLTCADPRTLQGSAACCPDGSYTGTWKDEYWGERTTYATAMTRCNNQLCDRWPRPDCDSSRNASIGTYCKSYDNFWTERTCTMRVKINQDGTVAIVHSPDGIEVEAISRIVQNDTQTFFRVDWSSSSASDSVISSCSSNPSCRLSIDDKCVCDVNVSDEQVFFDGNEPSKDAVLNSLSIGAFDPALLGTSYSSKTINGVKIHTKNGPTLSSESIFEVVDANGITQFRKNLKSTVTIKGTSASFRNPVHFISLSYDELYQAHSETDAALDHYFYHPNVAPFLALRFAQRFGISNPSPRYIAQIANAFRSGSYTFNSGGSSMTFGSGKYGDLGALVACVLLDREARATVLDADPAQGSLKEPLIKVIGLMRALDFKLSSDFGFVDFDVDMGTRIGQMAHAIPNVFSFFFPEHRPSGPVSLGSLVAPEAQVMTGPRTIDFLNGLFSLIKYGLTSCVEGFGRYQWWDDNACWRYTLGGNNEGVLGKLMYSPSASSSTRSYIDELSTLLTAGRLSLSSRDLINTVVAAEPNKTIALMKAQQLMVLTPEFHATNIVRNTGSLRPVPPTPPQSTRAYKAVVYVLLDGGMDSFNMLAPHSCSATNSEGQTLLDQYYSERTSLAINAAERSRIINAAGQPCSQFVVHEDLEIVQRLYNSGDLSFFANAGVLNRPVNKDNYWSRTKTALFGHNTMQDEAQKIDPFDGAPGTGILGRMCDILKRKGFTPQPITVEDASVATVGVPGAAVDPLLVSPYSTTRFYPTTPGDTFNPKPHLDKLNGETVLQSSLFGETFSQRLQKALFDNEVILRSIASTRLNTTFADTDYAAKLKAVATLITSRNERGTDRDVFFLKMGGWDHHSSMKSQLKNNFIQLNAALTSFYNEMKVQGYWNGVTLVITSDFSRTLTANSGDGSDHAWGGNYFVMGGAVQGGKIHGLYPSDITPSGPLNIGRGRLIPTLSWESVMNPIVEWMGANSTAELDYCLPNRNQTATTLFRASEVFKANA